MPLILDDGSPSPAGTDPTAQGPFRDEQDRRRRVHHDADVVIIGAGVFGSAAAVAMARQGRSVILLERSLKEPDRIVGELLQPGGVQALRTLGMEWCMDGIDAVPCFGYDVVYYGTGVGIPYPKEVQEGSGEKGGKRPQGKGFHHGRFIQKLREAAMKEPNVTVVETEAKDLVRNGWTGQVLGVECSTKGEKDYVSAFFTTMANLPGPLIGLGGRERKERVDPIADGICSISGTSRSWPTATPPSSASRTTRTGPRCAASSSRSS